MAFPKTLLAFQEQFPDEGACWRRRCGGCVGLTGFVALAAGTARATGWRRGVWSSASDADTRCR
jgi:hypothetical protein